MINVVSLVLQYNLDYIWRIMYMANTGDQLDSPHKGPAVQ